MSTRDVSTKTRLDFVFVKVDQRKFGVSKKLDAGLPDGFFLNQKSKFGQILEGLRWENVNTI
jgi:hypothetical protein